MDRLALKIISQVVNDIRNQGTTDRDRQDAAVFLEQAQQEDTWARTVFDMASICPVRVLEKLKKRGLVEC